MGSAPASSTPPARPLPDDRLAIDLLNTTWQTPDGPVDWLSYDQAMRDFTADRNHQTKTADLNATRDALVKARELIRRIVDTPGLDHAGSNLLEEIDSALRPTQVVLDRSPQDPPHRTSPLRITGDRPTNRLAVEALVDALTLVTESADRLRSCEHEDCTLWFLDTSKGGGRRWCSMSTCGNRAKARRHYSRSTSASSNDGNRRSSRSKPQD